MQTNRLNQKNNPKKQKLSLGIKDHFIWLLMLTCFVLMILPVITTFNEFLTAMVIKSSFIEAIQQNIVPIQARMAAALLSMLNIKTQVSMDTIHMMQPNGIYKSIYISWNCIGWQSLILLLISFATSLQGRFTNISKIETIIFGLAGTIIINIFRIAFVAFIGYIFGNTTAIVFHDYGSTLMIIGWLIFFWSISYRHILDPIRFQQ